MCRICGWLNWGIIELVIQTGVTGDRRANGNSNGQLSKYKIRQKETGLHEAWSHWMVQMSQEMCVCVCVCVHDKWMLILSAQTWPWKLGWKDILRQRTSVSSWLRFFEDSPEGLRNSLLLGPLTGKPLGPSVDRGIPDMLGSWKNRPGQMPKPKRPDPAGLSRSQVRTDGKDLSRGSRDVEARVESLFTYRKKISWREIYKNVDNGQLWEVDHGCMFLLLICFLWVFYISYSIYFENSSTQNKKSRCFIFLSF